jgi:hypothetical protein
MLTSAWLGEATSVETVVVLLVRLGSETVLEIFGELVIVVPTVVAPLDVVVLTLTTKGKLTTAPTART